MGLSDYFVFKTVCPWCKKKATLRFSTKLFDCTEREWKVGEIVGDQNLDLRDAVIRNCYADDRCGPLRPNPVLPDRMDHDSRIIAADAVIRENRLIEMRNVRMDEYDIRDFVGVLKGRIDTERALALGEEGEYLE